VRSNWLLLVLLGLVGCATETAVVETEEVASAIENLPYYNSSEFTPRWLSSDEVPADFHKVPEFSLTNQDGEAFTEVRMDGKITVVDFFFTSCSGICPTLTKNLGVVDAAFPTETDLLLLSHSVTPDKDTVEVLRKYADSKAINTDRWHLLTGDRELIYQLGREVYFVEEDMGEEKGPDDFLHTENLVLLDRQRHIRGIYNGLNKASVQQLNLDIQTLLDE